MSQNENLYKIADGVVNFCSEMKTYLEDTKSSLDTVLNKRYQANHTPYAVMPFEDEAHYWEGQLCKKILEIQHPEWSMDGQEVEAIQRDTYVIIRGNLKSGKTIRYDETKFNQLYINGERYTADYTFNGETPDVYERVTVFIVQTPFNITTREWGELIVDDADFPIENAEIYVNIGKTSRIQPEIEELLLTDTAESLYVNGAWTWMCRDYSFIKTLSVSETFSIHSEANRNLPAVVNYLVPNSKTVYHINSQAILNIDIKNTGNIGNAAFKSAKIKGFLNLTNSGSIGSQAFMDCQRLTEINIGSGVTSIETDAFYGCINANTVVIGDNVVSISQNAFGCGFKKLHLGKSLSLVQNTATFISMNNILVEEVTVSKGYHSTYTNFNNLSIVVDNCLEIFKGILENCANVGEDGRTAAKMTFRVTSSVRTAITNAYNEGDETALAIYELMDSKTISITT